MKIIKRMDINDIVKDNRANYKIKLVVFYFSELFN